VARFTLARFFGTKAGAAGPEPAGAQAPFAVRAAAIACLLIIAPVVNSAFLPREQALASAACVSPLDAAIIDLDEMANLTVSDAYTRPASFPRRVSTDDMLASLGEAGWYRDSIAALNDIRLLRGVTDAPREIYSPGFYIPSGTQAPTNGRILACVDPKQVIEVAQAPFMKIVSAMPVAR
jgi:hypothetical protein